MGKLLFLISSLALLLNNLIPTSSFCSNFYNQISVKSKACIVVRNDQDYYHDTIKGKRRRFNNQSTVFFASLGNDDNIKFKRGQLIQVEITRFGRLGASVDIVGTGHEEEDLIDLDDPILGSGLILQSEIKFYRQARRGLDVIVGEVLPAYVENYNEDLTKYDISLRPVGQDLTKSLSNDILDRLEWSETGTLNVGDKSTPFEIDKLFPGASKTAFKKAVSALYKAGKVKPGANEISLMRGGFHDKDE